MNRRQFNDRLITDGFPARWYVQDRLDEGTALLCRETDMWPGNVCICVRPNAISTDDWLKTARRIAQGFDLAADTPVQVLGWDMAGGAE